jgi:hypothetical protein
MDQRRFRDLTTVSIEVTVSRDVTPYSLVDRYQSFEGACDFYLQKSSHFYAEDVGSRFPRNIVIYLQNYTELHREGWSTGNALDLYLKGSRFEYRPGHR